MPNQSSGSVTFSASKTLQLYCACTQGLWVWWANSDAQNDMKPLNAEC
jgi:hypothetical protein